jgi:sterol desaturase/sphingolipid hydroxylase (fatty acid hydroxylase superfamily)
MSGRRAVVVGALVVLLAAAAGFCYLAPARSGSCGAWVIESSWRFCQECYRRSLLDPWMYVGIAVIAGLEWLRPALRSQQLFSTGLAHDLVWLVLEGVLRVGATVAYVDFLAAVFDRYLAFLTVHPLGRLPVGLRIAWVIVLSDFLGYFQHWLQHKVPWFWHFHAVHHSQRELNALTATRYHIVEYLIAQTATVFAFKMLAVNTPDIVVVTAVLTWYARFLHSNVRADFGLLQLLLVTPQSHRIHHSIDERHHDRNFGTYLCIWDRLFGTHYTGGDEYPATGIKDPEFPVERTLRGWSLLCTPMLQLVYPFVKIARDLRQRFERLPAMANEEAPFRRAA